MRRLRGLEEPAGGQESFRSVPITACRGCYYFPELSSTWHLTPSLDGVRANHFLQHGRVDLMLPLRGPLGIGTSVEYFYRRSHYQDEAHTFVSYRYPQVRAYFTWWMR